MSVLRRSNAAGAGLKTGNYFKRAENEFDLFITSDQNLRYQQNLSGRKIAILELSTNKMRRIEAAAETVRLTIVQINRGEFKQLQIP